MPTKPKKGKPVRYRKNDAIQYRKVLRDVVDVPILKGIGAGLDLGVNTLIALQSGQDLALKNLERSLTNEGKELIQAYFDMLEGTHKERFVQAHRNALSVEVIKSSLSQPPIKALMQKATETNVNLIRLIGKNHLPKVLSQVTKIYEDKPFDRQALAKLFSEQWEYRDYPLRRIARDQVSKSIGSLNRIRQKQIGVSKFEWSTSLDERVRDSCKVNEGKVFSWNAPPVDGAPGEKILCRCVGLAVFDL